MILNIRIEYRL